MGKNKKRPQLKVAFDCLGKGDGLNIGEREFDGANLESGIRRGGGLRYAVEGVAIDVGDNDFLFISHGCQNLILG